MFMKGKDGGISKGVIVVVDDDDGDDDVVVQRLPFPYQSTHKHFTRVFTHNSACKVLKHLFPS